MTSMRSPAPVERPILFSGEMIRAILDGRKTVTRRLVPDWQLPAETSGPHDEFPDARFISIVQRDPRYGFGVFGATETECMAKHSGGPSPYGSPGDQLWVRETTVADYDTSDSVVLSRYAADSAPVLISGHDDPEYNGAMAHWDYPRDSRPSIHMHRWASRIQLEITAVRVERLQDISEEQAKAEGATCELAEIDSVRLGAASTYRAGFQRLWQSINGPESWDVNPWVWVVEFRRINPR